MKKLNLFIALVFTALLFNTGYAQYKIGDSVSDFKLINVDRTYITLSQFEDVKGFIVIFTCNTCPVVKKYEERIIELDKEYREKGFPVIAINSNDKNINPGDSFEEMQKTAKKRNFTFPYLYDESQEVAKRFGATNTPHIYILSVRDGKWIVEYTGAIDNNVDDSTAADKQYVADAINSLLKGNKPDVSKTVAVGCSIKWKKS